VAPGDFQDEVRWHGFDLVTGAATLLPRGTHFFIPAGTCVGTLKGT